jgi:hypothetical protein
MKQTISKIATNFRIAWSIWGSALYRQSLAVVEKVLLLDLADSGLN